MTPPGRVLELRAPTAATSRLRLIGAGTDQPVMPEWNAERAFSVATESVWAWRCIEAIAQAAASCPIRVGLDPSKPNDHSPNARLAQLLGPESAGGRGPNPETSARQLIAWWVVQLLGAGRFANEIEYTRPNGGEVVALWPLPAQHVAPVPTEGKSPRYFKAFEFQPPGGVDKTMLPAERVFWHHRPAPWDWREPLSPLKAAGWDISVANLTDRYQYAFLKNDARPAAVMVTDPFPTEDERNAFQRQHFSRYGGADNAGRLAFLETEDAGAAKDAVHIVTLGLAQGDAQMLEIYNAKVRAITVSLGVPLSVIGDASGRTYSNADAEFRTFWRTTVRPILTELEEAINRNLAPLVGREVAWFDTSGVPELQPAKAFDPGQALALEAARLITPNEARAALDLAPVEGGDMLRPAPVEPPVPALRSAPPVVELHQTIESRDPAPAPLVESTAEARAAAWRRNDARMKTLEGQWERAFARFFERQGKAVVARVEGRTVGARLRAASEAREIRADLGAYDPDHWRKLAENLATDLYEQTVAVGSDQVGARFGVSFDLEAPWVRAFITDRANQLAGAVSDTTYASVQQALEEGVAQGASIEDLAKGVREVFDQASRERSKVIARTEVISASNGAAVESARSLGSDVVAGKEWIAAVDERTREDHAAADGQVVPVDGTFDVGGEPLAYPGDPVGDPANTISCRCAVAFVAAEAPK